MCKWLKSDHKNEAFIKKKEGRKENFERVKAGYSETAEPARHKIGDVYKNGAQVQSMKGDIDRQLRDLKSMHHSKLSHNGSRRDE